MAEDGLLAGATVSGKDRRRGWIAIPIVLGVLILPCLLFCLYLTAPLRTGAVCRGVYAGEVDLSNLTPAAAEARLRQQLPSLKNWSISVTAAGVPLQSSAAAMGADWDTHSAVKEALGVGREPGALTALRGLLSALSSHRHFQVPIRVHHGRLKSVLKPLARVVEVRPGNAGIHFADVESDDPGIMVTPERKGRKLDITGSARRLADAIAGSEPGPAIHLELPVHTVSPPITEKVLSPIDGKLAEFSTVYRPWQVARTHNLLLASRAINGAIIFPGQRFSYNKRVGQRLVSRGYQSAPIFVKGKVVDDTGGGVCQVATTVYNAALLANLHIVERNFHSLHTSYIGEGRDATVSWDSLDLKFRNSREAPIVLTTSMGGGRLTVRVWGHRHPGETVRVYTSSFPSGVVTYRKVHKADGKAYVQVVSRDPHQEQPKE